MPHHPVSLPARRRPRRAAVLTIFGASLVGLAAPVVSTSVATATVAVVGDSHSPAVSFTATEALVWYDRHAIAPSALSQFVFAHYRDRVAAITAAELGIDPAELQRAWRETDTAHQVAVLAALSQLGVAYEFNASAPGSGFDCSGLTLFAWARAGRDLYHQSGTQIGEAAPRDRTTARAGDLVHYPGHVMMYLGVADAIVHAANHESDVELSFIAGDRAASVAWGDPS